MRHIAPRLAAAATRTSPGLTSREVVQDATARIDADDTSLSLIKTARHVDDRLFGGDFSVVDTLHMRLTDDRAGVVEARFTTSVDGKQQGVVDCEGFGPVA